MFDKLDILNTAQRMAVHAANRQSVIAQNVANSDTPGYRAQDLGDFADTLKTAIQNTEMRATRSGHLSAGASPDRALMLADAGGEASPNGNTVSLEQEMVRAGEVRHQHDLALSVYSKSLGILRASLGRR